MTESAQSPLVLVSTVRERPRHQKRLAPAVRPSWVAIVLALAHHLQRAIDQGAVESRAATARALGLSRVRVTQILDLLQLAPDLQELALSSQAVNGREPLRERDLRTIAATAEWSVQRRLFAALRELRHSRSCA